MYLNSCTGGIQMIPTGDFDRFRYDVMERYNEEFPITFGILIADYNQTLVKEYILNYLNIFDNRSNKYIDFFIPGYTEYGANNPIELSRTGKRYFFNRDLFINFIEKFQENFGYEYEFNPVLILVELKNKDFINSKKIIIDLDQNGSDVKRAGVLFQEIFNIAKKYVDIKDFSRELKATYIKGACGDSIINAIDNSILTELNEQRKNMRRFKIQ